LKDSIKICFPESDAELDLLTLPFKSTYRVLSWQGPSNGTLLTPDFNIIDLEGKYIVIKSFRIIPYYPAANAVDMYVTDGITVNQEIIQSGARIDRLFDIKSVGTVIVMLINGAPVNFFNANFPLDVDLQNIYYKYPEKVQTISLTVNGQIIFNLQNNTATDSNLKVNMEVYLI